MSAKTRSELPCIMPRQSGYMSSISLSANQKPAKPLRRGRREKHGSGNGHRPESAGHYGLKQEIGEFKKTFEIATN